MNKYFRKHSLKIYRSPRLLRYPIPDDPEPSKTEAEQLEMPLPKPGIPELLNDGNSNKKGGK